MTPYCLTVILRHWGSKSDKNCAVHASFCDVISVMNVRRIVRNFVLSISEVLLNCGLVSCTVVERKLNSVIEVSELPLFCNY